MSVQQRVKNYRERMRARGYRPIQMWVPDVRTEAYAEEARRQARLVADGDEHDQAFIDAVSDTWGDE